jgi:hypothetical protein
MGTSGRTVGQRCHPPTKFPNNGRTSREDLYFCASDIPKNVSGTPQQSAALGAGDLWSCWTIDRTRSDGMNITRRTTSATNHAREIGKAVDRADLPDHFLRIEELDEWATRERQAHQGMMHQVKKRIKAVASSELPHEALFLPELRERDHVSTLPSTQSRHPTHQPRSSFSTTARV